MSRYVFTLVLGAGLLFCVAVLRSQEGGVHILWNQQNYAPAQPIAFSHRLHAGELQMDCLYCHFGADKSRHAGIPPANVCMNCHKFVTATLGAIREEDEVAKAAVRKDVVGISRYGSRGHKDYKHQWEENESRKAVCGHCESVLL